MRIVKRDTRLLSKKNWDDPSEFLQAGSTEEADLLAEWDRTELVESLQEYDAKLYAAEQEIERLKEFEWKYEELCK